MDSNNGTQLNDRFLWFDGDSTVQAEQIQKMITLGMVTKGMCVEHMTGEIKQFNSLVNEEDRIRVKEQLRQLSLDWNIPYEYLNLNVRDYVIQKFSDEIDGNSFGPDGLYARSARVLKELELYQKLGLFDVLRTLIFIINKLDENKIVWGVGRGSGVSSYVLYLIGVHNVDSVEYDLEITEFLR